MPGLTAFGFHSFTVGKRYKLLNNTAYRSQGDIGVAVVTTEGPLPIVLKFDTPNLQPCNSWSDPEHMWSGQNGQFELVRSGINALDGKYPKREVHHV